MRCCRDDFVNTRTAHAEVGEGLVSAAGKFQFAVLVGDDGAVHLFGELYEPDLPVQGDDRKGE